MQPTASGSSGSNGSATFASPEGTPDHELAYLFTGGAEGLDRFYREYAPQVMSWVIRLGEPELEPETIANEVFTRALEELDSFHGKQSARAWLYRLTQNSLKRYQRRKQLAKLAFWKPKASTVKQIARNQREQTTFRQRRAVQKLLQSLSPSAREALVLTDLDGLSVSEVSELTGRTVSQVNKLVHQARRDFAQKLKTDKQLQNILRAGRPDLEKEPKKK